MVADFAAHQAVGRAHHARDAAGAAAPGHRPGTEDAAVGPVAAAHHVVAIAQRGDPAVANHVAGVAAHQAVGRAHHARDAAGAAAPGHRPGRGGGAVFPVSAAHHVVAIAQRGDPAVAHQVVGAAADQAVGRAHHARDAAGAVAPGYRPGIEDAAVVPVDAVHHVVAIAQRGDPAANLVAEFAAHQAVGRAHHPRDAAGAAAPGRRPGLDDAAVGPHLAAHHVVAIAQRGDPAANPVVGAAADQAVGRAHHALDAAGAAAPGYRPGFEDAAVGPHVAAHHVVAIAQRGDPGAADLVAGVAAHQAVGRAHHARDAAGAAAPGHRPGRGGGAVFPVSAAHHVVAIAQRDNTAAANSVVGGTAHQAVGRAHQARGATGAVAPGYRPGFEDAAVVPVDAVHHVVAVAQREDPGEGNLVAGGAADQAVGRAHHARDAAGAAAPGYRPGFEDAAVGPVAAAYHVVAVAQREDPVEADVVVELAAAQRRNQRAGMAVVQVGRTGRRGGKGVSWGGDHDVVVGQHGNAAAMGVAR